MANLNKNPNFPTLFFHDLSLIYSFVVSHPLYFSYVLFFSPYLFKFIFFISPLFFTTTLLIFLALLHKLRSKLNDVDEDEELCDFEDFELYKIVFHDPSLMISGDDKDERLVETENAVEVTKEKEDKSEEEKSLERLFEELDKFEDSTPAIGMKEEETKSDLDEFVVELQNVEPVFMKKVSGGSTTEETKSGDNRKTVENSVAGNSNLQPLEMNSGNDRKTVENSVAVKSDSPQLEMNSGKNRKIVENFVAGKSNSGRLEMNSSETRKTVENSIAGKSNSRPLEMNSGDNRKTVENSVVDKSNSQRLKTNSGDNKKTVENSVAEISKSRQLETNSGENQKATKNSVAGKSNSRPLEMNSSWRLDSSSSFGSYGSMRKEKEWKRTLACKLFEERHNSEGGEEGMDSLWESYETDNSSSKPKNMKEAMINQKKTTMKNKNKSEFKYFDEDEDDEDDEFMGNGQLCCLKALKLSAGKMNLGMGKPNLVKISKALKGFGWLHHVSSKHGKKV